MLITYDISLQDPEGASRLRRVAQYCLDYGVRVQYSVFECDIAPDQWVKLKAKLLATYNPATDSLRFYHLGSKWRRKVEHHGAKPSSYKSPTCGTHPNPRRLAIAFCSLTIRKLTGRKRQTKAVLYSPHSLSWQLSETEA